MYKKVAFAKAFGASLGIMLLVAAVGVYGGLAFAVPVTQAGGGSYLLEADSITASNAIVYPSAGNDKAVAVVEFKNSKINGLKITKTANTPVGQAEVVISSNGEVQTESLMLKGEVVNAENSDLSGLVVDASHPQTGGFAVNTDVQEVEGSPQTVDIETGGSDGLKLSNFDIQTQYIVTNNIGIPGLSVDINLKGGE